MVKFSLASVLTEWGNKLVNSLRENIAKKGLNASGKTSSSINYHYSQEGTKDILTVTTGNIIAHKAIENPGRKPNKSAKFVPVKAIRSWIDAKGISPIKGTKDSLAWAISRKIARDGWKVPNKHNPGGVLTDTINDKMLEQIATEIKVATQKTIIQSTFDIPYPK